MYKALKRIIPTAAAFGAATWDLGRGELDGLPNAHEPRHVVGPAFSTVAGH